LAECIGAAGLPLSEQQLAAHVSFVEQQLERTSPMVEAAAAAALRTLSRTYLVRAVEWRSTKATLSVVWLGHPAQQDLQSA